jgi:hypothetical protein
VPILLSAFDQTDEYGLKLAILQALFAPWANPTAIPALFAELDRIDEDDEDRAGQLGFSILSALIAHPIAPWRSEYVRVASTPSYGSARSLAVEALGRLKKDREELVPLIESLVGSDDGFVVISAANVLGNWKTPSAQSLLRQRIEDEQRKPSPDKDVLLGLKRSLRKASK